MSEQQEIIHVHGAPDVASTIYFTAHGPVLWQSGNRALTLRWIGAEPGTAGYLGSLSLDRAHDWQQFEQAMPRWKVPSENIVYADREGNIGEHSTGLAPLRKGFDGLLPLPADGHYEWSGFVPNEDLPHSFNPAAGFVATANHKMIPDGYPYAVGFEWGAANRYERIRQVLDQAKQQSHKLSVEDMEALQTDVVSLPALRLQKLLADAIKTQSTVDPDLQGAADLLLHWDGALRTESSAAALYELWTAALRGDVPRLVVPEAARGLFKNLDWEEILEMLTTPQDALFGPDAQAKRDGLLRSALLDARRKLIELQGEDPQHWSWGGLHRVTLRHALDGTPALAELFDRGPFARPGDGDTVQATSYSGPSFDQIAGASYREIFDLKDWDNAKAINVPGQSGQPGSKHYDDLLPLWRQGKYFPLKFSKAAIDEVTTDTMTLEPARTARP
jgi:penicillin amidase